MGGDRWLERWKDLITGQAADPPILELGCGDGRDTGALSRMGFTDITATDVSEQALSACAHAAPHARRVAHDLRQPLPFTDEGFPVVIASLCLHYFPWDQTERIVGDIRRCLGPKGLLLCRLNSTRDAEHGATGHPEIARHYYEVDGQPKRFFDRGDVDTLFADGWESVSVREMMIDRYARPKAVWEIALRKW